MFGFPKKILVASTFLWFVIGCGQTPSHRQSEKKQTESDVQSAKQDLLPALGRFEGQMLMYATNKRYNAVLDCTIIYKVIQSPQDPSQTISIPKVSGTLTFTVLMNLHGASPMKYMDLLGPMAFYNLVGFNSGDYDPDTHDFNLPYSVPEFPNDVWGQLQGKLDHDVFLGQWTTKVDGTVGRFQLTRVKTEKAPK